MVNDVASTVPRRGYARQFQKCQGKPNNGAGDKVPKGSAPSGDFTYAPSGETNFAELPGRKAHI